MPSIPTTSSRRRARQRRSANSAGISTRRCQAVVGHVIGPPPRLLTGSPPDRFAVLPEVGCRVVHAVHGRITAGLPFGRRRESGRLLEEDRLVSPEDVV